MAKTLSGIQSHALARQTPPVVWRAWVGVMMPRPLNNPL
jgi:hypothetical protein